MAAKLPRAITDMQLTAVRTLTGILPAPALSASAGGSTATLTWTPPTPSGQSVIAGYRLYRGTTVGSQTTLVGTFTGTSTTDPLSGTQYYRIEAFDQYQTGVSSSSVSCSSIAQTAIKWVAGHYADYDTVVSTGNGLAAIQFELDLMKPYDNCLGYMIAPTWGNLQQANGVYTFTNLDSIINYLTNRSGNNFNRPKYYWISVVAGSFTKMHPGSAATFNPNDVSILPQYLMNNVGLYGAAAWRSSGVITNTSNSGWWGGDGNGNTYGAALWRPAVSEEWIKLHEAIAAHCESDPYFMGIFHGENSFYQGTGSTNGDGSYNDITFQTNNKTWMQRCTAAFPTSNVAFSNTYLKFQNNTEDLTNWMMTTNTLSHPVLMAQTDTFGASYNGGAGHNSWGMAAYVGAVAGIPDFRSKGLCACEVQAPDIGFFKNTGGWARDDILASLNNHERAQFSFWAIVPRNTATVSQQTALVPANWFNGSVGTDGLGAFINANPLINTGYPTSYPTFIAAPTNFLITAQTANSSSLAWTASAGATGGYNIYRNGALLTNTAATSYVDTAAPGTCSPTTFVPATIYAYSIRATNGSSESASVYPSIYLYRNGIAAQGQAEFSNGEVTTWNSTGVAVPQGSFSARCVYAGGGGQFQPISQTPQTPAYALEIGAFNYCVFDVYLTDTTHKFTLGLISRPGGTSGEDVFNTKGADPWIAIGGTSIYGTIGLNQWGTLKVPLSELSMGVSTFMGWISGTTCNMVSIVSGPGPDAGGFITGPGVSAGTFISGGNPNLAGPFTLNHSLTVGSSGSPVLLTCQRTNMYKMAANVTSGTTVYFNNIGFTTT